MTAAETERRDETELIRAWRTDALERAGYTREAAYVIASRSDIDLHLAVDLLGSGCPHELALRILL